MAAHAAEPDCQISRLLAHLAVHDGEPVDRFVGAACPEGAQFRVRIERAAEGFFARYDLAVCPVHLDVAHRTQGYQGVWSNRART